MHSAKAYKYSLALIGILFVQVVASVNLAPRAPQRAISDISFSPYYAFIENKGQWSDEILYGLSRSGMQMQVEEDRLRFTIIKPEDLEELHHAHHHPTEKTEGRIRGHSYSLKILDANLSNAIGQGKKVFHHNYFYGSDRSRWASNVGLYEKIHVENSYKGIDFLLYTYDVNVKYEFIVQPGGDPKEIQLVYEDVDGLRIEDGRLVVSTSVGEVVEKRPYAYQEIDGLRIQVPCEFRLRKGKVSFKFPESYRKNYPLVIDPELIFATYSGATGDNWGTTATFDSDGNLYGGGTAWGLYPTTPGAFDVSQAQFNVVDMAISKFSDDGSQMIYSTYIGGFQTDVPHSMIVNSQDQLIILGTTSSTDFPSTIGAIDGTFNGGTSIGGEAYNYSQGSDITVTVLNANGTGLVGSSYIGGSGNDGQHLVTSGIARNYADQLRGEVVIDSDDNIYIASTTLSADFPTTPGAYDNVFNGGADAVIFSVTPDVTNYRWSTYLGGSGFDAAFSLKLDGMNVPFICGTSSSSDFPTTAGVISPSKNGTTSEGFISRISDGTLSSSTFLPPSQFAYFIEIDENNSIYTVGQSEIPFPINNAAYSRANSANFVLKTNDLLTNIDFSTQIGNGQGLDGRIVPTAFLVDDCERIYISGWGGQVGTNGNNDISQMPITNDAFQQNTDGEDFYLMVLDPGAAGLNYATYYGGNLSAEHVDGGTSRFDKLGIIYQAVCAGCGGGGTDDFPTTQGVVSNTNNSGNCNLGVFKLDFQLAKLNANVQAEPSLKVCPPFEVQFNNFTTGSDEVFYDFDDGDSSTENDPSHIFDSIGVFEVEVIVRSALDCVEPDTTIIIIEVVNDDDTIQNFVNLCEGEPLVLNSSVINSDAVYEWQDASNENFLEVNTPGVYYVNADLYGCEVLDSFVVTEIAVSNSSGIGYLCEGDSLVLNSTNPNDGALYQWNDGSNEESITVTEAGTYWVESDFGGCIGVDSFFIEEIETTTRYFDFDMCEGETLVLQASKQGPGVTHRWQDASVGSSLEIQTGGIYYVENIEQECPQIDSFIITEFPGGVSIFEEDVTFCKDVVSFLESSFTGERVEYTWQDGSSDSVYYAMAEGTFWVRAERGKCITIDTFNLVAERVESDKISFPNVFSPNYDGLNDIFFPYFDPSIDVMNYELRVYNRWGQLLFISQDPSSGWDGLLKTQESSVDVYVYVCEFDELLCNGLTERYVLSGDVTLIR